MSRLTDLDVSQSGFVIIRISGETRTAGLCKLGSIRLIYEKDGKDKY